MFILKSSLLVVLVLTVHIDASVIQLPILYIFSALANRFPKRFNSLFELRVSPKFS